VYRSRGATFVVILADTSAADARSIAERARLAVSSEPIGGIIVTVSVGVATAPAGELLDYDAVYAAAAARLDAAKRAGYDRTVGEDDERAPELGLIAA
ncbi:MAG: diguanylate cyclase, partial [Solirubrobacteraceae bacterium]|nr:diguanylate cyclase [Solirubrobacteraceae bacterium]